MVEGSDVAASDPLIDAAARVRAAFVEHVPEEVATRHVALLASGSTETPIAWKQWRPRRALTIAVAAALSVVLLGGSAVAAAATAGPGDLLYGVKRAAERLDLSVHSDPSEKARLHLAFAQRRLGELSVLLERQRAGEDVDVAAAMRAYREEVANVESDAARVALGADFDALLAQILQNLQKHVDQLTHLRDTKVPEQAREAIQRAIDNAQKAEEHIGRGRAKNLGRPGGAPSGSPGNGGTAPGRAP